MLLLCHIVTLSQGVGYVTRVVTSLVTKEFRDYFY